jgi:hypothetical protein
VILDWLRQRKRDIHVERFRPSPWVLAIDPCTGAVRRQFRLRTPRTSGYYDEVEGLLVALYRVGDALFFRAGDRVRQLQPDARSRWTERPDGKSHFALSLGGESVLSCDYTVVVSRLDAADPNFEVGRNDFLRAVHGIVSRPARWHEQFWEEQRR